MSDFAVWQDGSTRLARSLHDRVGSVMSGRCGRSCSADVALQMTINSVWPHRVPRGAEISQQPGVLHL